MINEMREMGLPEPEFSEHFDFMVVFRNGESAEASNELNPRQQTGLQLVRDKGSLSTREYVAGGTKCRWRATQRETCREAPR